MQTQSPIASEPRVVYVSHVNGLYGAGRSLLDLLDGVVDDGVRPLVLMPERGPLSERLERRGIESRPFFCRWWVGVGTANRLKSIGRLGLQLPSAISVARRARAFNADLIHSNTSIVAGGALAAKLLRLPHVWHVREFGPQDYGFHFDLGDGWARRLIGTSSEAVIAISRAVAREYQPYVPDRKLRTIYDGIRLDSAEACESAIKGTFPRNNPPSLVVLGYLQAGKRQHEAIRALARLRDSGVPAHLTIVGAGDDDYRSYLGELVTEFELEHRVAFPGYVENAGECITGADAVLMCSRQEALGRVTVEAMLAGTPVIGARSGATAELIDHEQTGLLYEPGHPEELAESVKRLLGNPTLSERLAATARRTAESRFDVARQAGKVAHVYKKVLDDGE